MVRMFLVLFVFGTVCTFGCRSAPKMILPVETVVTAYDGQALDEVMSQAMEGEISAMMTLAYRYEQGIGTSPDVNKAAEWYLLAAQRRDVEACYRLALIYANPDSPLYNFKSGKSWLRRAKRMGHAKAGVQLYAYPARPVTKK